MPVDHEQLLARISAWAHARPDIRAALVIGSRARSHRPADEWSDLDIVLLVDDPNPYINNTGWLTEIAAVKITFSEPLPIGAGRERRVLFDGGLDVDFAVIPADMVRQIPSAVAAEVFGRGFRVLLDRAGLADGLAVTEPEPARPLPTAAEFAEALSDFWYHAVWTAKKLRRGELWTAKWCCDGYLKRLLLKVVEWHAQVCQGRDHDTWHDGRFLEQWADHRALAGLGLVFAHYNEADIRRALWATMDLFRWLTKEISAQLDCPYPTAADEYATDLVGTILGCGC